MATALGKPGRTGNGVAGRDLGVLASGYYLDQPREPDDDGEGQGRPRSQPGDTGTGSESRFMAPPDRSDRPRATRERSPASPGANAMTIERTVDQREPPGT